MYNKEEIIKKRKIHYKDFIGRRFSPSLIIKKYFLKIFLDIDKDFGDNFIIKTLRWDTDRFRILLKSKNDQEVFEFFIEQNIDNCDGHFCTDNICLGIHNNTPNNSSFLRFLVSFSKKGKLLTLDYFLKILSIDPKVKKEYYQIFWEHEKPPFSIIQDWAHDLHKMRFLVHEGVFRNIDQSLDFSLSEAHIQHSERECLGIGPELPFYKEFKFFNFPKEYYDHNFDKVFYLTQKEKKEYIGIEELRSISEFTDLDEDDIVMGKGTEKLEKSIDSIISKIDKDKIKMMSFNCCCVPRIVGDDIYSTLKRAKKKINIPFILQGQLEKTPFEQKIVLLESYLSKIDTSTIKVKKKSISLFGYHESNNIKKLSEILLGSGIKINTMFIPTIDVRLLPLLFKSELFVFSPNKFQEEIFEYPFKGMNKKYISPSFPFGIEKTSKWFEDIFSSLGMKYSLPKDQENIVKQYNEKVSYIKNKDYKLGIVFLGKQELKKFLNPNYMNNIDVLGFLREMGFIVEFFIYDNFKDYLEINNEKKYDKDDGNHDEIKEILKDKIGVSEDVNINFFSSEKEMYKKLEKKELDLLYSDVYFDDRVSGLGLNQFNIRQFYSGYEGALDTINEMIKLIEMTYFRKFSKYLKDEI